MSESSDATMHRHRYSAVAGLRPTEGDALAPPAAALAVTATVLPSRHENCEMAMAFASRAVPRVSVTVSVGRIDVVMTEYHMEPVTPAAAAPPDLHCSLILV